MRAPRARPRASNSTGQSLLDRTHDLVVLGLDERREASDDFTVAADEELLEVPPDVAGVAFAVGDRGELLIQLVAIVAVHFDLLRERERHAVARAAERLDLVRR